MEPLNKGHIGIRSTVPCSTVEPLNKGHIGIRSTVPCSTEEPLNKGHIGIRSIVPCRKDVLISEVNNKPDDIVVFVLVSEGELLYVTLV